MPLVAQLVLGAGVDGQSVGQPMRLANRHGLIAGATGTGKTVTLQRLVESFSDAGVAVFAADVKDPYHADRVLSMLTAAEIEHHGLLIFFDPNDLSGIKYGCPEAFCRPIRAVSLFD